MKKLNTFDWFIMALLVVGGLNWGLVGLFGFDLVAAIVGEMSFLSRVVYILVGAAAFALASRSICYGKLESCSTFNKKAIEPKSS